MTERTQRQHSRGFATIVSGDGRFRLWISRPAWDGKITCNLGFGLGGRMLFVDAVDRLGYVRVDEATRIDGDLSALTL